MSITGMSIFFPVFPVFLLVILLISPVARSAGNCSDVSTASLEVTDSVIYLGCRYNQGITITFTGKSGATAINLNQGTVEVGIWIKCPTAHTRDVGPLHILVSHMSFRNAVFNFTGVLPQHSSLEIRSNTFLFSQIGRSTAGPIISSISIGSMTDALLLNSSTAVMVVNNSVASNQLETPIFAAVCIVGTRLTIQNTASFLVSGNVIKHHDITNNIGVYVVYMRLEEIGSSLSSTSIEIRNHSYLSFDGNNLSDSYVVGNACVVYLSLASVVTGAANASSTSSMAIHGSSFLSMVDNSVSSSYITRDLKVVNLNVTSSSVISRSASHRLSILNVSIQDFSTLNLSSNMIYGESVAFHAYVVWVGMNSMSSSNNGNSQGNQAWIVSNESAIVMSDNIIAGIATESASAVFLNLSASGYSSSVHSDLALTIVAHSEWLVRGNTVASIVSSKSVSVVILSLSSSTGSTALYISESGLAVCNNRIVQSTVFISIVVVSLTVYSHGDTTGLNSLGELNLALAEQAFIAVDDNEISRCDCDSAEVAYLQTLSESYVGDRKSESSTVLTLSIKSTISMSGNGIRNSNLTNATVAYFGLYSTNNGETTEITTLIWLFNRSSIKMSGNYVWSSVILGAQIAAWVTGSSTVSQRSSNSSLLFFLTSSSYLSIDNNHVSKSAIAWITVADLSMSILNFRTGNGDMELFIHFELNGSSAINLSGNTISDCYEVTSATAASMSIESQGGSSGYCTNMNSIVITGSSVLTAAGNRIVNTTPSMKTVAVSLRLGEGLPLLVKLNWSSWINVTNNIINISSSVGPQGSVELVWLDFLQMALIDSSLIFRGNELFLHTSLPQHVNLLLPSTDFIIVVKAGKSISLLNSVIEVAGNDIRTTFPVLFLNLNASVTGSGSGTLLIQGNTILASSPRGNYSDGSSDAVYLLELTNIRKVIVTNNSVSGGLYSLLRVVRVFNNMPADIIVSANAMTFSSASPPRNTSLAVFESFTYSGGPMHFEDNIIKGGVYFNYNRYFRFLRSVSLSSTPQAERLVSNNVLACGNLLSENLLLEPKEYFEPSNYSFNVCLRTHSLSYTASKGESSPSSSVTVSGSPSTVNRSVSMSQATSGTLTAEYSASNTNSTFPTRSLTAPMSLSLSMEDLKSTTGFTSHSVSVNASATVRAANDSFSKSRFSQSLSSVGDSNSLTSTETQSVALPVVERNEPILLVAVPAATTATLSAISSSIGGVTAAVDSQVIAAVGLVSCARREDDDETGDLRALSVVALDNTCEGVLLGNTIAIGSAAFLSAVAVAAAMKVQVRRYTKAPVGPAPTLITACATARAPQLLLTLCAYFMSSYALCGLRVGGAGLVAFVFSIIVVVSFPVLTVLFGARRLLPVTYAWQPRILGSVGSFVFQSWALDPSIDSHKLFGSVFGPYRRLSCVWTLTAHMSFIAGLPMMVATESSGTCGPLFAVSTALFFLFSIIVVAARPRRTALADTLHSLTLLVNGLVTTDATVRLYHLESHTDTTAMENLGTVITALTVIRLGHTVVSTALNFLAQRSVIPGVEFQRKKVADFEDNLLGSQQDDAQKRKPRPSMCDGLQMPIANFRYSGLLWPLPKEELANEQFVSLQLAMPNSDGDGLLGLVQSFITASVEMTEGAPVAAALPRPVPLPRPLPTSSCLPNLESQDSSLYLSEEDQFRRELARYYGGRQIDELLLK